MPSAAAEKSVAEYKDKLPQAVVDSINAAIVDVRGVMESENPEVRCALGYDPVPLLSTH